MNAIITEDFSEINEEVRFIFITATMAVLFLLILLPSLISLLDDYRVVVINEHYRKVMVIFLVRRSH